MKLTINSVTALTEIAAVNYDEIGPITEQVKTAKTFFAKHPQYVADFLVKPFLTQANTVDMAAVEENAELLGDFDIIGITEKELGPSMIERCKNLAKLRRCLSAAGHDVPIHIFGCFEPTSIILLTTCGGDIFDGLTWARYALHDGVLFHRGSLLWSGNNWRTDDATLQRLSASENLGQMTGLMFNLRSFAASHEYDRLGVNQETLHVIKSIMTEAARELD